MKKYFRGALVILMGLLILSVFVACKAYPGDYQAKATDVEMTITTHDGDTITILDRGAWKHAIIHIIHYDAKEGDGFDSGRVDSVLVALQKEYEIIDVVPITGGYGYTISLLVKVEKKR